MKDQERNIIVAELTALIENGNAHLSLDETIADLPAALRTVIPDNLPYSIWQLVDHIRTAQRDIVEFCISADYKSPVWPDGYWSPNPEKVADALWENCLAQIKNDRQRFFEILNDESTDFYKPLPHGTGQNIFREALLIADHNAYHLGEILVIRRLLKCWR